MPLIPALPNTYDTEVAIPPLQLAAYAGAMWGARPGRTYEDLRRFGFGMRCNAPRVAPELLLIQAAGVLLIRFAITAAESDTFWRSIVPGGELPEIEKPDDAIEFLQAFRLAAVSAFESSRQRTR